MDHTKTLSQLIADTSNGIGVLNDVTACEVDEERNGSYTLSMKISIKDPHFSDITVGGVLKVEVNEEKEMQLFRIRRISKPLNGIVSLEADHISYDLSKTSVPPFSTNGITNVFSRFESTMIGGSGFSFFTDIVNSSSAFRNPKPQSCRALLGGQQGSVLDVFGGEYEFDNATVKLLANRGADHGVRLSYGKNITDIKQDENIDSMYTAVMPYAIVNDSAIVGDLQTIIQVAEPRILNLDLSSKFSDSNLPTVAGLNAAAQAYINANNLTAPKISIDVSFVALWQTEEYKHIALLERVHLCDTVHVYFEKLGIEATAKVIKTEWDVLKGRYKKIEIGDAKSTLAKTISSITDGVDDAISSATGYLDERIGQFTDLIAQGLGLFVTKEPVGETGGVRIYLHNKPQRVDSQCQWTINANGLAVSQDYGQTWTAGIDSSGNAIVNSLSANIIRALQIYGSVIRFGSTKTVTAQTNGSNTGVIFDGDGTVDFSTNGAFQARNKYSSGNTSNLMLMENSASEGHIRFSNHHSDGNEHNYIDFKTTGAGSSLSDIVLKFGNYSNGSMGRFETNTLEFKTTNNSSINTSRNQILMVNRDRQNTIANRIWLDSRSGVTVTEIQNMLDGISNCELTLATAYSSGSSGLTSVDLLCNWKSEKKAELRLHGASTSYSGIDANNEFKLDVYDNGSNYATKLHMYFNRYNSMSYIELRTYASGRAAANLDLYGNNLELATQNCGIRFDGSVAWMRLANGSYEKIGWKTVGGERVLCSLGTV